MSQERENEPWGCWKGWKSDLSLRAPLAVMGPSGGHIQHIQHVRVVMRRGSGGERDDRSWEVGDRCQRGGGGEGRRWGVGKSD